MEVFKAGFERFHQTLEEIETAARQLPNHNFADLIKAARGRLLQASEHPDLEKVGAILSHETPEEAKFPFDPPAT